MLLCRVIGRVCVSGKERWWRLRQHRFGVGISSSKTSGYVVQGYLFHLRRSSNATVYSVVCPVILSPFLFISMLINIYNDYPPPMQSLGNSLQSCF